MPPLYLFKGGIRDMLTEKIKAVETELENTMKAMQQVKQQIAIFNKKGEELAAHATFLNGKLEAYNEFEAEVDGEENV